MEFMTSLFTPACNSTVDSIIETSRTNLKPSRHPIHIRTTAVQQPDLAKTVTMATGPERQRNVWPRLRTPQNPQSYTGSVFCSVFPGDAVEILQYHPHKGGNESTRSHPQTIMDYPMGPAGWGGLEKSRRSEMFCVQGETLILYPGCCGADYSYASVCVCVSERHGIKTLILDVFLFRKSLY